MEVTSFREQMGGFGVGLVKAIGMGLLVSSQSGPMLG